jgi:hypothetical protein
MARAITAPELALLRGDGQWSKLYLAIFKPNTIYTARLDVVPTYTDLVAQIAFDTGSGTLGDVKPGMTLYVGTTAGAFDLGMCRIRKDPISGWFYIGLTSEINWQAECHLTVVDDFDLWAKHAVIADSALVMDVDVEYDDQHTDFNPVPVLGPHAVAWLDEATVDVTFDASDSWVPGSTISAYAWTAPGSSASSGMSTATPTITYNAVGIYRVFCTVTAANAKTTVGVRHVFIYDRDANQPATVFQLAQCIADYDTGGWMFDMAMEAEAGLGEIRDRSLVVLFAEDWYGETKQSIGPIEGRENIVCVGRIMGESIRWDRETGQVHFTVQGPQYWLNKIKAFPIELTFATNTPDSWSVIPSMTVDRVLWHILYWHSTAIETMDFYPPEDTRLLPDGKTLASTIWGQLADIAQSRLLASPGFDRFGRLFVEIDPQMVPEADRTWATVMALTDDDWQEGIDLQRVTVEDVSLITLSSQQVDESGSVITLYSLSPGHVPRRYGEPMGIDRLLAASQAESNELAGLALGWYINEFPDVPVILAQNNRMIDLFPRQFCSLDMETTDNPREIAFDGNLIPRRMTLLFDAESGYMHPEFSFESETFEQVNTDGDIPDVDDTSIPAFPGLGSFPEIPDLTTLFPGDISSAPDGPPTVLMVDEIKGLLLSKNFNEPVAGDVTWQFWNSGIDTADLEYITTASLARIPEVFITPGGSVWMAVFEKVFERWIDTIYFAPALGALFTKVIDQAWLDANEPGGVVGISGMGYNPNKPEEIAFIAGNCSAAQTGRHLWIGNRNGFIQKTALTFLGQFANPITYGNNEWGHITSNNGGSTKTFRRFAGDGSSQLTAVDITNVTASGATPGHWRAGTSKIIIAYNGDGNTISVSTDGGATFSDFDVTKSFHRNFAVHPGGQYILAGWDNASGKRGKSSDGGTSWSGLPNLPAGGEYAFAYAGGAGVDSRWIAARGVVRYSNNAFGAEDWLNKEGNLGYLIPVGMVIRKIIVPGISGQ